MLKYAEYSDEDIENFLASYGRDTAVLPPQDIESIIVSSGFDSPI
jgi:tRNA (cmo5U34)-methyltransferase